MGPNDAISGVTLKKKITWSVDDSSEQITVGKVYVFNFNFLKNIIKYLFVIMFS